MAMKNKLFKDIKIGVEFWYNGKFWKKMGIGIAVSDSTIKPMQPDTEIQVN